jgi:hypothetical protein
MEQKTMYSYKLCRYCKNRDNGCSVDDEMSCFDADIDLIDFDHMQMIDNYKRIKSEYKEKLLTTANLIKDNAEYQIEEEKRDRELPNPELYIAYEQGRFDAMKKIIEAIENY